MGISPGMTEIVFNARRTLNVLSAETFPRSTNSVIYLQQGRDDTQNKEPHDARHARTITTSTRMYAQGHDTSTSTTDDREDTMVREREPQRRYEGVGGGEEKDWNRTTPNINPCDAPIHKLTPLDSLTWNY